MRSIEQPREACQFAPAAVDPEPGLKRVPVAQPPGAPGEEGLPVRLEHTATYPAPLRQLLRSFSGTWSVEPTANGSRVTLIFEGTPRFGALGRALLRLMGRRASGELEGILDAYERGAAGVRRGPPQAARAAPGEAASGNPWRRHSASPPAKS